MPIFWQLKAQKDTGKTKAKKNGAKTVRLQLLEMELLKAKSPS